MNMRVVAFGLTITSIAYAGGIVTKSPTGKARPKVEATSPMLDALTGCKSTMQGAPNPANAGEAAYSHYFDRRDAAIAADPAVKDFDASLHPEVDYTPTKMLPICNKYFTDYATGVGAQSTPLSANCASLVQTWLKLATNQLANARSDHRPQTLQGARGHLESARYAMYSTVETMQGGRCATPDKTKLAFAPLKQAFDQLEPQFIQLETTAGIKFAGAPNGVVGYIKIASGQPAAPNLYDVPNW